MTGVLTAAAAGGSLMAGHVVTSQDGVHVEQVALQSFGLADVPPSPATAAAPAMIGETVDPTAAARLLNAPEIDVDAVVAGATSALRDSTDRPPPADTAVDTAADAATTPGGDAPTSCEGGRKGFGAVDDDVAVAGEQLRCAFGVDTVFGVAGRSNASDHPAGKALDFMVDRATGERLAEYALANRDRLGISYVIYRQRIDTGDGWESMEDRGGVTANHMDHVHISFD